MKPLLILLAIVGLASAKDKDIPWELATNKEIPGRLKAGECMKFATSLFRDMKAHDVESHVLVFVLDKSVEFSPNPGYNMIYRPIEGHAMCVYSYPNGSTYVMDNGLDRPMRVSAGDAIHIARVIATPSRNVASAYFADIQDPPIRTLWVPDKKTGKLVEVPGWEPGPNFRLVQ